MSKRLFLLIIISFIASNFEYLSSQTTITMEKEGGVYFIPCTVNGLKLKFIFDTGASNVTISLTEAMFMLKNGFLNVNDIKGSSYAQLADGNITENTTIILREIEFAGLRLYDIEASVVHALSAPLLLGQSAISKLGKIEIDPANNKLTVLNGSRSSFNYTNYSGTVKVYSLSPILEKPNVNSKEIGLVKNKKVTIIRKENNNFYYVKSGKITGYLWTGWIIKD